MIAIYQTTCRICLNEDAIYPIFESNEEFEGVYKKFPACLQEKIEDIDGYPRYICLNCKTTSESISDFIAKFEKTCEVLKGIILQVKNEHQDDFTVNPTEYESEPDPFLHELLLDDKPLVKPQIEKRYAAEILESLPHLNVKIIKTNSCGSQDTICNEYHLKRKRGLPADSKRMTKNTAKAGLNCGEQKTEPKCTKSMGKTVKNAVSKSALRTKVTPDIEKNSKVISVSANHRGSKQCANSSKQAKKGNDNIESYLELMKSLKKQPQEIIKNERKPITKLCELCGLIYKTAVHFKTHQRYAHKEKYFKCTVCPKKYFTKQNLQRHNTTRHENVRTAICDHCGKAFTSKYTLNNHIIGVHRGNRKTFKCQFCEKIFRYKKGAIIHERAVHTGVRPSKCNVCDSSFYDDCYLKEHMRLHTGDAPYTCPVCARGYARRGNMKSHMRNHKISELDPDTKAKIKPNYFKFMRP